MISGHGHWRPTPIFDLNSARLQPILPCELANRASPCFQTGRCHRALFCQGLSSWFRCSNSLQHLPNSKHRGCPVKARRERVTDWKRHGRILPRGSCTQPMTCLPIKPYLLDDRKPSRVGMQNPPHPLGNGSKISFLISPIKNMHLTGASSQPSDLTVHLLDLTVNPFSLGRYHQ